MDYTVTRLTHASVRIVESMNRLNNCLGGAEENQPGQTHKSVDDSPLCVGRPLDKNSASSERPATRALRVPVALAKASLGTPSAMSARPLP